MSQPPPQRPDFAAPGFAPCYRHPDRSTGISCQRCGKPICGECMNPASVGFQCPSCVRRGGDGWTGRGSGSNGGWGAAPGSGAPRGRSARTVFGGALTNRQAPMTKIIMAVVAGLWLLGFVTRGLTTDLLVLSNAEVALGQYWRLVSYGFTSAGLFQVLMNLLVLWLAGQALEGLLGAWRFLALYVLSGVGGATLFYLAAGPNGFAVGSAAAVIGLLAANGVVKLRRHEDVRPDIGLLVLLVLYSILIGGGYFWAGQLGGIVVGALTGVILAYAPRARRTVLQVTGLIVIALLCVVAVIFGGPHF